MSACPLGVQGIVESDPQLEPFSDLLRYRFGQYLRTKSAIEQAEGSLASFAQVPHAIWCHRLPGAAVASAETRLLPEARSPHALTQRRGYASIRAATALSLLARSSGNVYWRTVLCIYQLLTAS